MPKSYIHPTVRKHIEFYGDLLFQTEGESVSRFIKNLSEHLYKKYHSDDSLAQEVVVHYESEFDLRELDNIQSFHRSLLAEYRINEEGLSNEVVFDHLFEKTVNAIVDGNTNQLEVNLKASPSLIKQKSPFGHGGTLLHYIASNGVETWRQKVPYNLNEITQILLTHGADKDAKMKVYGGHFTVLELFSTSAHPREAGIYDEIINTLQNGS